MEVVAIKDQKRTQVWNTGLDSTRGESCGEDANGGNGDQNASVGHSNVGEAQRGGRGGRRRRCLTPRHWRTCGRDRGGTSASADRSRLSIGPQWPRHCRLSSWTKKRITFKFTNISFQSASTFMKSWDDIKRGANHVWLNWEKSESEETIRMIVMGQISK